MSFYPFTLLPLMKPICSGDNNFLRSIKFIRRFSRIELNSLAIAGPIARPLQLSGSLVPSFLKMGFKKFKAHLDGYICSEKIMLTNLSKMSSKVCPKIFMYSPMISSGPGAFPPFKIT